MQPEFTTIEVKQDGQKPRLFRFEESEITIGFSPRCLVSLEPQSEKGTEIVLTVHPAKPSRLRILRDSGSFRLNSAPCSTEQPVKPGDVLTIDSYQITIRNLPGAQANGGPSSSARPESQSAAAKGSDRESAASFAEPESGANPGGGLAHAESQTSAATAPQKAGLSYLQIFFAPVQEFLLDDDVAEIMINGPRQIYIERKGKLVSVPAKFSSEQALQAAVMNVARSVGRFFDKDHPRLDARLPDGSRVHALMPPLSRAGTTVAIRKFRREKLTVEQLIQFGSISPDGAKLLDVIVKLGKNLIVSGATSSGKTSVLNVLSALIPEHERILVLEDASELQLQQTHTVCFETRKADEHGKGEVTIRDLLHSALRLRPDRLVVGEIRGGEALDLLQAMNTGHEGSMSTIHANTPRDSLFRMETCALLSGIEIPLSALREQVGSAIHIVIQTARLFDGSRKITAITEVLGLKDREYQLQDILVFQQGSLAGDKVQGRHVFTGYQPAFIGAARNRGFDVEPLIA